MKAKIFLTGLVLIALTLFANAQDPTNGRCQGNGACKGTTQCSKFVDANKDGVCDNKNTTTCNKGNGNGNCNGSGQGRGQGGNCAMANKNGTCPANKANTKK
jgi:hypothetical protein